jgi:hypothetical protein
MGRRKIKSFTKLQMKTMMRVMIPMRMTRTMSVRFDCKHTRRLGRMW